MKKKTSLWISGITTVAMLAVAVGSFAAWDSLKPTEGQPTFSVSTGTPTTVTVASTPGSDTNKLLPDGAIKNTGDAYEVTLGTFTASVKDGEATKTGDSAATGVVLKLGQPTIQSSDGTKTYSADDFVIELSAAGESTIDSTDLKSGTTYTAKVKFAKNAEDASWNSDKITELGNIQNMKISYSIEGTKVEAAPAS